MNKTNYIFNISYPYNTEYNTENNFSLKNEQINNKLFIRAEYLV